MEKKNVVIELRVKMIVKVPTEWTGDDIDFWLNESSHCLNNEVDQLYMECNDPYFVENSWCNICARAEGEYIRNASEEDMKQLDLQTQRQNNLLTNQQ